MAIFLAFVRNNSRMSAILLQKRTIKNVCKSQADMT